MKIKSSDRTGILILHVWIEEDARDGFRARITQTQDATSPDQAMATAANPEDIYTAVRTWVEEFVNSN